MMGKIVDFLKEPVPTWALLCSVFVLSLAFGFLFGGMMRLSANDYSSEDAILKINEEFSPMSEEISALGKGVSFLSERTGCNIESLYSSFESGGDVGITFSCNMSSLQEMENLTFSMRSR